MRSHLSTLSSLSPLSHQWIIYIIYRSPATYKLVVFADRWKSWSTLVGSAWSFWFFHPRHNGQWLPIFYPTFYPLHLLSYLDSWKRASISLFNVECQTRELLVTFLTWFDAVLDWGLNPGPPALEASTLPPGYWGGGWTDINVNFKLRIHGQKPEVCKGINCSYSLQNSTWFW